MKIAIVGAGSSGSVTLKYLLDTYPSTDVICFEKSHSVRGCWGNQRADFVSTSTKYTTQFSCFRRWSPEVAPDQNFAEFYRGAEFGDYLDAFADHFNLRERIRFGVELLSLERTNEGWSLLVSDNGHEVRSTFDAVYLCTGLVNMRVPIGSPAISVAEDPEAIRNATVVVVGGGESAADVANYLAKPAHNNTVFLSLRSGIRVSPRYHPIRGVPSDFLRNRLLLSFDKGVRNWIGEHFVTFRIRFDGLLARRFPHGTAGASPVENVRARRRAWDLRLKARAKGELFNVFHNKSDDFLDAVANERLEIVGPPVDEQWIDYFDFDRSTRRRIAPDLLVQSTGYRSGLPDISDGIIHLKDFYHGCVYTRRPNLFLIGFARPIIGNIPTIGEMQARYTIGVLSGKVPLPASIEEKQAAAWHFLRKGYSTIDIDNVYPVEQYHYCDLLAQELGITPALATVKSLRIWLKILLTPASTTHYVDQYFDRQAIEQQSVYTPPILVVLLILMRLLGYPLRLVKRVRGVGATRRSSRPPG